MYYRAHNYVYLKKCKFRFSLYLIKYSDNYQNMFIAVSRFWVEYQCLRVQVTKIENTVMQIRVTGNNSEIASIKGRNIK